MGTGGNRYACALFCAIMSAVAVPFLILLGVYCVQESHMIELPKSQKRDAAWGCFGSAALYAVTFFVALSYKMKIDRIPSARQAPVTELQPMCESTRQ
mmetsp:Transcript_62188/g.108768  ORF Transcript_62188/g.108768 Transcript_62188/m.108768 type:complete len:98 (+) Transcript_62188:103-396(+)